VITSPTSWARRSTGLRWGSAFCLATAALGGNVWVVAIVLHGFGGPSPASRIFGRPNVQIPISDAAPRPVPQVGHLIGFSESIPPLVMNLLLVRLNRDTQTASFVANVVTPPRLLLQIPGRDGNPAVRGSTGEYRLTAAGHGLSLPLRITESYGGGLAYQTRISLADIVQSANDNNQALTISFDVPLQGRPGAFPDDWYELASDVVVFPPTNYVLVDPSGVGQPSVPVRLTFAAGPAMRGFSIRMVSKPPGRRLVYASRGHIR
jgi:hypothetical protein